MRDYGKVFSRIWESSDFRSMSEDGRTLSLYLLTCQHGTIAGVFRVPDGYASEDLQWSSERVTEGFRNLEANGFATRCEASKWVWVTKYLEWNEPENPNQRKAVAKIVSMVPHSCSWKAEFTRQHGPSIGLDQEPDKKPLPNPSATVAEPGIGTVVGIGAVVGAGTGEPAKAAGGNVAEAPSKRGCRIGDDWVLPKAWGEWAIEKHPHWTAETVRSIAKKFHNYWKAKSGKDATKLDWKATWENWCDSDITQREQPAPKAAPAAAQQQAESLAKAERLRIAMASTNGRAMPAAEVVDA